MYKGLLGTTYCTGYWGYKGEKIGSLLSRDSQSKDKLMKTTLSFVHCRQGLRIKQSGLRSACGAWEDLPKSDMLKPGRDCKVTDPPFVRPTQHVEPLLRSSQYRLRAWGLQWVEQCPLKIHSHLESQNGTLLGNRFLKM